MIKKYLVLTEYAVLKVIDRILCELIAWGEGGGQEEMEFNFTAAEELDEDELDMLVALHEFLNNNEVGIGGDC